MNPTPCIDHTLYREPITAGAIPDITRTAVRGIVTRGAEILMVYSPVNGDYKFPGGGVEPGETHAETLVREVEEETGVIVAESVRCIARIREFGAAMEPDAEVFVMDSYYYLTETTPNLDGRQSLDDYEDRLRFTPRWVTISEGIENNNALLTGPGAAPRWTQRETWLLTRLLATPSLLRPSEARDE